MEIREIGINDFEAIHRLVLQIQTLHAENRPDIYRCADPLSEEEFRKEIELGNSIALAAVENGKIVGYALAAMRDSSPNPLLVPRVTAFLNAICIDETHQKEGIGAALLHAVRAEAKSRGASSLELMVWSFNKSAEEFYRREGMTVRSSIFEQKL